MSELAVVIPAYRKTYLEEALNSLAKQSYKDFTIYIGDDNSPDDLRKISDLFAGKLDISYTKFNENIGSKNLVNQWKRCIELTNDEKWIWLFSDDDIAHEKCVESFYHELSINKDKYDVYRFNTGVINADSELVYYTQVSPKVETSEELAYNILLGKRGNSMPDHIFSREIYRKTGGIVFTDYAQGADWATSIRFSKEKGLCIIDNAIVFWRYSGTNISSTAHSVKNQATLGHLQFLEWVLAHFTYLKEKPLGVTFEMMENAVLQNFQTIISYHYRGYNLILYRPLFKFLHNKLGLSALKAGLILAKIRMDLAIPGKVKRIFTKLLTLFK